jgi:hypothetical protein
MENYLDAVDWQKLNELKSVDELLDVLCEDNEKDWILFGRNICGWSDSYGSYVEIAEILDRLEQLAQEPLKSQIKMGLKRLISSDGEHLVNEFKSAITAECGIWISASPESTREIYSYLQKIDFAQVKDLLLKNKIYYKEGHINAEFMPFIEQYQEVLKQAVERGYGIVGSLV